jgi:hypothetical protein
MSIAPEIFRFRSLPSKQAPEAVDVAAGVIRGVSVMQAVEALGHGMMIDDITLRQVADLGNAATGKGIKSRFGHPGACDNALGKKVGHTRSFRVVGDKVLADFHLSENASPNGDMRAWILKEAQDSPEDFGLSVVIKAQRAWKLEGGGEVLTRERPANAVGKLPFARVTALTAVDFVDEPAANRDGLFADADLVAAFSATSSEAAEEAFAALDRVRDQLGIDLDAIAGFAERYLAARREVAPINHPTPGNTMKLAATVILALATEFPAHIGLIDQLAKADKDEAEVRNEIGKARLAALSNDLAAAQTKLAEQASAHATALQAEKEAHTQTKNAMAALKVKHDALAGIKSGAEKDPGGSATETDLAGLTGEARWKAEFAKSPELQERFAIGGVDSYISFKSHEKVAAK